MVDRHLPKVNATGSNPVARSVNYPESGAFHTRLRFLILILLGKSPTPKWVYSYLHSRFPPFILSTIEDGEHVFGKFIGKCNLFV